MKLIIEIDLDGAAFQPIPCGEVQRILDGAVSDRLRFWYEPGAIKDLRDINGNVFGSVRVEG